MGMVRTRQGPRWALFRGGSARKGKGWGFLGNETDERQPQDRIELSPKHTEANSLDWKSRKGGEGIRKE